jgi:O-antigen ligase
MPPAKTPRQLSPSKIVTWILVAAAFFGAVSVLYLEVSPLLAAIVYVGVFIPVAFLYPHIALLLIFALTPFQNDLSAGGPLKFSIAEVNLLFTVPVCLLNLVSKRRPLRFGPVIWPVLLYLLACLASSLPELGNPVTLTAYIQMVLYLIVTVVVFASISKEPHDLLLPLYGLAFIGIFFGLASFASKGGYVLGIHKNNLGGSLASAVVISAELWFTSANTKRRKWLTLALLIETAGLVFTLSRGSWMAAIVGLTVIGFMRRQVKLMARVLPLLAIVIAIAWMVLPEAEREYATDFDRNAHNIEARYDNIAKAKAMFKQNPLFGLGVEVRKQMDATNLVWVSLAESGIIGFASFVLIYVVLLRMIWKDHKRLDLHHPLHSLLVVAAALGLGRVAHGMVDHYWVRGSTVMCWAAVGMATRLHANLAGSPMLAPARRNSKRKRNPFSNPPRSPLPITGHISESSRD